jgi:hypothetical protein
MGGVVKRDEDGHAAARTRICYYLVISMQFPGRQWRHSADTTVTIPRRGLVDRTANGSINRSPVARSRIQRHVVVRALLYFAACPACVTSSVMTLKLARVHNPKEVTIATSVASRPRAIKMRPTRGVLCRASNVYQRPR